MAITGSPDIFVSEQDLSTFIGTFDVTTAAIVGDFEWGPVEQVARITNEARLKTYFGLPNDRNFKDWLTAKNYLEYSNSLALVRVCLNSARNAFFKPIAGQIAQFVPDVDEEGKPIEGSGKYEVEGATTSDEEKLKYSPLTAENSEKYSSVDDALRSVSITNFPSYVAFKNADDKFTIERASSIIYQQFGAMSKYVLDLNAEQEFAIKNGEDWESIPKETMENMNLGTAYAIYNPDILDKNGNPLYFYIRKKYERKIKVTETKDSEGNVTGTTTKDLRKNWLFDFERDSNGEIVRSTNNDGGATIQIVFRTDEQGFDAASFLGERFDELVGNDFDPNAWFIDVDEIQLNVKNTKDYAVQEHIIADKQIPILAKYPGKYGNRLRVAVINKPAYDAYMNASNGKTELESLTHLTKNSAIAIVGRKNLADDAIVVAVSLYNQETEKYELKEYGTFSLTKGSTDITGYDNYVFNFFTAQSNYVYFNREAFEELYGYKYENEAGDTKVDLTRSFINIDANLTGGEDYQKNKLAGSTANYSEVVTTISNGIDYEVNTQMTTIVDKDFISDKTPIINIVGGVGAYMKGWDLFKNEESDETQVQLLMQGGGSPEIGQYIIDLAEQRKDCVAFVSPSISECVNVTDPCERIAEGTGSYYSASSYAFMDGNYKYQYDSYNDVYRWMPLNGDTAGLCAYIDGAENPWMSIGGRQIRNCIKLAFYPSKADRDILFEHNVNPVTNFSNEGNVIWGDWTRISNSAFNFLGVRRMFLYVEKNIKQYARTIMFKQNDQITRDEFVLAVTPFLDSVVGGRGIQEYGMYAGSDVTTKDEMDKGIFRAKFAIKPVRSIRYVDLVFVAIRSDMSVSEVIE